MAEVELYSRITAKNSHRVMIKLINGKTIPFSYTYDISNKKEKYRLVEKILTFVKN